MILRITVAITFITIVFSASTPGGRDPFLTDSSNGDNFVTPSGTTITRIMSLPPDTIRTAEASGSQPLKCPKYTILSSRGTHETQVNPKGTHTLITYLTTHLPGGTAYEVVYPATNNFLQDPERGRKDLVSFVQRMRRACPSQPLFFAGYSQGAMVTVNALNDPELLGAASTVRGVVLYGNPYFRAGLPQDRGTARTGAGIGMLKNVVESSFKMPDVFVPITRDYCNEGDFVCQGVRQETVETIVTPGTPAHHYAGTKQEQEAIYFAYGRLRNL